MASPLVKILSTLAPAPAKPAPREYDGLELFRWKFLVFRPADFKFEGLILSLVGVYLLMYLVGKAVNGSRAKAAIAPYSAIINAQFSYIRPLLTSSPSLHLLYASGRRNVLSLHATVSLLPIHDLPSLVIHFVKSIIEPTYDGSEGLVFDLTLGRGEYGLQGEGAGVWAVVDKGALRQTRDARWDLTFPKLNESAALPNTHVLFTEHSDVTDALLKTPNVGIAETLADPAAARVLKYLLISDVSATRPSKGPIPAKLKSRQVILSVSKPSNNAEVEAVQAWLQVALNIADLLSKPTLLKPEVTKKLIKTRQMVDLDLASGYKKELDEDKPVEETAEDRRAARKKAEREKLSEKERKRLDDLEKKREMRKLSKKQGLKGQM
ncbi:hypothetical protein IAU59_006040 [Kwoniella sp. CBS 9459]